MTEAAAVAHDRPGRLGRRRPFSTLMKKLANLKASSTGDGHRHAKESAKVRSSKNNNPYPESGRVAPVTTNRESQYTESTGPSRRSSSIVSADQNPSVRISDEGQPPPTTGARSMAPTVSTEHDASRSMTATSRGVPSITNTTCTVNGRRGGDSTFSSPAPSVRSLTTTLTTIQTAAPNTAAGGGPNITPTTNGNYSNSHIIHFNQPFPTASPASAIPAHLATSGANTTGHPTTYHTATANNLLTDNASILTLASSSKRGRRRSFDTDASVRALAPSSLWGGSRESLPLSVLSANLENPGVPTTPGLHRTGTGGVGGERASIYSATTGTFGVSSERNSFYAKQGLGSVVGGDRDTASVRSGLLGHGRAESISGSIGGFQRSDTAGTAGAAATASPLTSPREIQPYVEVEEEEGVNGTATERKE
ncbi:hypothetical protein QBC36DRAFT_26085 [Triangularia setosa]|uniref:Ca2+-modulated nonselective cation channel polycystin n=1 Tax=Triangularia setosa TaxID=2587417 RepID=A0AAN6W6X4_9PEZI|nr:hypothetical protein QBC36DRAFT_26085 [Podospora setosa]